MSPLDAVSVLGALTRAGYHVLRERAQGLERPTTLDRVPASPEALTTEWLTAALCCDHPGARVVDLTLGPGSTGTSSRRAVEVRYNDAGINAELPTRLFTKSTPTIGTRMTLGVTGIAARNAPSTTGCGHTCP